MDKQKQQQAEKKNKKLKESEIVRSNLKKTYDQLSDKTLETATREAMLAPQSRMIKIGGEQISASDLRFKIAQNIEKLATNPNTDLEKISDFQMMIANSIETINSETSSSQEYFRWLDESANIIKNMNDGYVSEKDLEERNNFLDMSYQREAELLVCLSLYANSQNPLAAQKAQQLRYKLVKLREMRSAIETSTKNKADTKVSEEEYHRAIPYYKLCKGLAKVPFGYDIPSAQKKQLGINHDDDDDINDNQLLVNHIINAMLDELQQQDETNQSFLFDENTNFYDKDAADFQPQKTPSDEEKKQRLQQISDKLKELTGRRRTFGINFAVLEARNRQNRA